VTGIEPQGGKCSVHQVTRLGPAVHGEIEDPPRLQDSRELTVHRCIIPDVVDAILDNRQIEVIGLGGQCLSTTLPIRGFGISDFTQNRV
jgi:hypothetical protein